MSDDRDLADRRQRAMQRKWAEMDRIAALGGQPTETTIDLARDFAREERQKPRIRVKPDTRRI